MRRYIGIMVGNGVFKGIPAGRTSFENLSFYDEAGEKYEVTPCYFRFEDINPGEEMVEAYVKRGGAYLLQSVPKPVVIHNRIFTGKRSERRKIRKLKEEGIVFFNENNRYKKFRINDILAKEHKLRPHLPQTMMASEDNVKMMMEMHRELILKPNNGSLGSGIVKLTRDDEKQWEITYRDKKTLIKERFSSGWPPLLKQLSSRNLVIIQEMIPLARSKGRVFDLRVSVQKNEKGEWQVSGIVGKVAKKDWFLTNAARGGRCHTLTELLKELPHLQEKKVTAEIEMLSLSAARQLEKSLPHLADLGFDIGITNEGFPMIIECNCRELRYSFRNAGLDEEWKQTHFTPIGYARFLLDSGR
ncbi:YheC/YheD family protein [Bacillus haikouensis]|uniref:YheC/YheD family endospore coat-associated protein n=1 Tax=Bacillus haikouensis TaxID=1510468 RepID=UPI0015542F69|nr:YheC/YheD family protein [Bacillus haikouensis]NQD66955.1 YheC/YheD family protein [Bacillus haikouensis]